jgi:hypothetical protein
LSESRAPNARLPSRKVRTKIGPKSISAKCSHILSVWIRLLGGRSLGAVAGVIDTALNLPCVCPTEKADRDNWETVDQKWQSRYASPGRLERDYRRKGNKDRSRDSGHVRMLMICALATLFRETDPVDPRL